MVNKITKTKTERIIGGDYNARIAGDEALCWEGNIIGGWKTKDEVINTDREKMLEWMNDNGIHILTGDYTCYEEGELTFIGGPSYSVNDHITDKEEGEQKVKKIKIGEKLGSDHMRLEVEPWANGEEEEEE